VYLLYTYNNISKATQDLRNKLRVNIVDGSVTLSVVLNMTNTEDSQGYRIYNAAGVYGPPLLMAHVMKITEDDIGYILSSYDAKLMDYYTYASLVDLSTEFIRVMLAQDVFFYLSKAWQDKVTTHITSLVADIEPYFDALMKAGTEGLIDKDIPDTTIPLLAHHIFIAETLRTEMLGGDSLIEYLENNIVSGSEDEYVLAYFLTPGIHELTKFNSFYSFTLPTWPAIVLWDVFVSTVSEVLHLTANYATYLNKTMYDTAVKLTKLTSKDIVEMFYEFLVGKKERWNKLNEDIKITYKFLKRAMAFDLYYMEPALMQMLPHSVRSYNYQDVWSGVSQTFTVISVNNTILSHNDLEIIYNQLSTISIPVSSIFVLKDQASALNETMVVFYDAETSSRYILYYENNNPGALYVKPAFNVWHDNIYPYEQEFILDSDYQKIILWANKVQKNIQEKGMTYLKDTSMPFIYKL